MYRVDRNNFYQENKNASIQTPEWVSIFLFELLNSHVDKKGIIFDPCVGEGSLLKPWKEKGYQVQGIDIKEQGFENTKCHNYLTIKKRKIEKNSKYISGIGEIGLDKTYVSDLDGFKNQELVFNKMLSIAEKLGKPVSIHSRATLDEILTILPSYSISGILLHWFAGSKKQLKTAMERNYFVSYGPAMVYAKDKQVLLLETNTERILVETDGPVKFSRCFGFKVGQIAFLPSVVFCAAKVLHMSYDDMAYQIEENCEHYLGV